MSPEAPLDELSRGELIALLLEQQGIIAELRAEMERLKRWQHRQAAPFSKGQVKTNPQRPGRKPGKGLFSRRAIPLQPPAQTVTAAVPRCCPRCGGHLEQECEEVATTTDLPLPSQPVVTAYRVPVCRCQR